MAPDPCNPCDCIPGNIPNDTFKQMVMQALCQLVAGGGIAENVVVTESALPDGAATAAKQDDQTALLTTIDADTAALAGTVAGSEQQVDIVAPLPAGTNAIGKLAANSGIDIGDVDVTSVIPGTGTTNLGKAQGGLPAGGDVGMAIFAVRNDGLASGMGSAGRYMSISANQYGALFTVPAYGLIPTATTMQSAAVANGNGTSLTVNGFSTAVLNVVASVAMAGGTTVNFEGTVDGTTWVSVLANRIGTSQLTKSTLSPGDFEINCAGYTSLRARISSYSAGTITVKGYTIALAGANKATTPASVDPAIYDSKTSGFTTAQTGTALWTPASGNRVALTKVTIGTGGTTAGRVIIWFGASGDTTYTEGTDQCVFDGEFAPSATARPGAILCPAISAILAKNTDYVLRVTTDAGITVRISCDGYEFTA